MSVNSNIVVTNWNSLEYNKFVEFVNDTNFPPVTVIQHSYDDNLTQQLVFNKTAVLTYDATTNQVNGSPFGDNSSIDAFGRLRTSLPSTLLDAKQLYDKLPQVFDEVVNGGRSTFTAGDSLVTMETSANGGYVIRQTTAKFNYQPGKSLAGVFTFVASPETNIVKRIGLFQGLSAAPYTPSDGMYLEMNSTGPSFHIIKTQGTSYTISAPQSAWNVDKMDGSGPSGISLDFTKAQIFAVDYEWLGVGRIRFGFYVKGKLYYAHYVTNFNALSAPYMTSGSQPVRYEMRQTGAGTGTLKHICASVIDEGTPEEIGVSSTASTSAAITVQNNIMTPILAIRMNPNTPNFSFLCKAFELLNTDNTNNIRYAIYKDPSFNGSLSWLNADASYLQYAVGSSALTLSGGFELFSGFAPKSQGTSSTLGAIEIAGALGRFGTKINGTPDTLVIAGMGMGATATVLGSVNVIQLA